jgi:hypothetical protein
VSRTGFCSLSGFAEQTPVEEIRSLGLPVREIEDYTVELSDVHVLELLILPDKKDSEARASLLSFRLG